MKLETDAATPWIAEWTVEKQFSLPYKFVAFIIRQICEICHPLQATRFILTHVCARGWQLPAVHIVLFKDRFHNLNFEISEN